MKRFCVSEADMIDFLTSNGFTEDDGKLYLTADTARTSYLTVSFTPGSSSNITYHGSDGNSYVLASATGTLFMVDIYALKNSGAAFRVRIVTTTADGPNTALCFAAVSKTDQSGYEYFFVHSSATKHDKGTGIVAVLCVWTPTNAAQTDTIAALATPYDDGNGFSEVCAKSILLTQYVAVLLLYTIECGGKKYLSSLSHLAGTQRSGGLALEID